MNPYLFPILKEVTQREIVASIFPNEFEKGKSIKQRVCEWFGIDLSRVDGVTRRREVVICRQVCIYVLRFKTKLSLVTIGRLFNRHHSTAIYSVQAVEDCMKTDKYFRAMVKEVEDFLAGSANFENKKAFDAYFRELRKPDPPEKSYPVVEKVQKVRDTGNPLDLHYKNDYSGKPAKSTFNTNPSNTYLVKAIKHKSLK